ncbi:MAG: S8 family serine peptidase, partial [Bacteroidota bacterium]
MHIFKIKKPAEIFTFAAALLFANSAIYGQSNALQPIKIDQISTKKKALTENDLMRWSHLDLVKDTVPGMSVDRAYAELIKKRKGAKVIVGVVDSGLDTDHPDLKDRIWVNQKEIAGNQIDDDKNGYVDDIHGWNFLG